MKHHIRQIVAEARAEAGVVGMTVALENRRRHPQLLLNRQGKRLWRWTLPLTPSCADDVIENMRRRIRRKIEELR